MLLLSISILRDFGTKPAIMNNSEILQTNAAPLRCLIVSFEDPRLANNGGAIDTLRRIEWLNILGAQTRTISWRYEIDRPLVIDGNLLLPVSRSMAFRSKSFSRFLLGQPFLASLRHPDAAGRAAVIEFAKTFQPHVVLMESAFCLATVKMAIQVHPSPVILRIFDETTNYLRLLRPNMELTSPKSVVSWLRSTVGIAGVGRWEKLACAAADEVHAITAEVAHYVSENAPHSTCVKVFGPMRPAYIRPESLAKPTHDLVFSGNLYQSNNLRSLSWLIDEVMPLVWAIAPLTSLLVAGASSPRTPPILSHDHRITVERDFAASDDVLSRGRIMVNPQLFPGGVSIKLIEPLRRGMRIVTTELGTKGLSNELFDKRATCIIADGTEHFARALIQALTVSSGLPNAINDEIIQSQRFENLFGANLASSYVNSIRQLVLQKLEEKRHKIA